MYWFILIVLALNVVGIWWLKKGKEGFWEKRWKTKTYSWELSFSGGILDEDSRDFNFDIAAHPWFTHLTVSLWCPYVHVTFNRYPHKLDNFVEEFKRGCEGTPCCQEKFDKLYKAVHRLYYVTTWVSYPASAITVEEAKKLWKDVEEAAGFEIGNNPKYL